MMRVCDRVTSQDLGGLLWLLLLQYIRHSHHWQSHSIIIITENTIIDWFNLFINPIQSNPNPQPLMRVDHHSKRAVGGCWWWKTKSMANENERAKYGTFVFRCCCWYGLVWLVDVILMLLLLLGDLLSLNTKQMCVCQYKTGTPFDVWCFDWSTQTPNQPPRTPTQRHHDVEIASLWWGRDQPCQKNQPRSLSSLTHSHERETAHQVGERWVISTTPLGAGGCCWWRHCERSPQVIAFQETHSERHDEN